MLELKHIVKDYPVANTVVHALKDVNLQFRSNEFVSILGPSGCGKTTLLNIIGGLDKYTTGDLVIDGVSTKDYKSRDWDTYRNHTIGFVFQTYNLIPHQSVLKNVELALTLAGTPKSERKSRAEEALRKVGLGEQIHKRPNQLSGGQMQRVAIARAIVNEPSIILADEPTGALDTETGIQIMELLKEMSRDRLVIMVTHNPELAESYSSRIIKILDGEIVDDSAPLTQSEVLKEEFAELNPPTAQVGQGAKAAKKGKNAKRGRKKRSSMSFWTAFKLSLRNLFTKKGRTVLTSFAGSIGIIGIALILSVSNGMTNYINLVEEQTLTSYPLQIESSAMDLTSLVSSMMNRNDNNAVVEKQDDTVYSSALIYDVANVIKSSVGISNDLKPFKRFLDQEMADVNSKLHEAIAGIQYDYDVDLRIFSKTVDGRIEEADVSKKMNEIVPKLLGDGMQSAMGGYLQSMSQFSMKVWREMLPGDNGQLVNQLIMDQYNIYGSWPNDYNEVVLVLNRNMEFSDMALITLGLLGDDYLDKLYDDVDSGKDKPDASNIKSWSFDDILRTECKLILNGNLYQKSSSGNWVDVADEKQGDELKLQDLYENKSVPLKVSGIVWAKDDTTNVLRSGSIAYTHELTEYLINESKNTDAVIAQEASPDIDIFTGRAFSRGGSNNMEDSEKAQSYRAYYSNLSYAAKEESYWNIMALDSTQPMIDGILKQVVEGTTLAQVVARMMSQMTGTKESTVLNLFQSKSDEEIISMLREQIILMNADALDAQRKEFDKLDEQTRHDLVDNVLNDKTDAQLAVYYDNEQFSSSTYEGNMKLLANVDLSAPVGVNIYASSFSAKDVIAAEIERYNEDKDEEQKIEYTDLVALVMSAVTMIVNAVTYVLIAFVAISLIVSSIMIGVITLISVQERTKEIGILRAIGASKHDVSSMFNAETLIIGFAAGLFGVVFTYLLCLPLNFLLHSLTGIASLNAMLPPVAALILILISVGLTLISGFIPSRSAAKKDPVVALRTE